MENITVYRRAMVALSHELWQEIFTEGWEIGASGGYLETIRCNKGLPKGAKLVHSYYDFDDKTAYLVFEHKNFEPIPKGLPLPIIKMEFGWTWTPIVKGKIYGT